MIFILFLTCYSKENIYTRKTDLDGKNILLLSILYHFIVNQCVWIFLIDQKNDMYVLGSGNYSDYYSGNIFKKYIFINFLLSLPSD